MKGQTNLLEAIWGDYFAGGAGASTGISCAVGEPAYFAVNHSEAALSMYHQNHPHTLLYREDVFDVDPVKICGGRPIWLLWASPDCTHHSKARGGKPVSKHIRGLPWAIVRAALEVRPSCVMFENVEEIQSWGPCVTNGKGDEYPDPERKGETFKGFLSIMTSGLPREHPALLECCEFLKIAPFSPKAARLAAGLGYEFEGRELVAADYGAPTIRKRFYGVFRCDGRKIIWPEPTHSRDGVGGKKPWRSAGEIIDWSLPCPSVFESKAEIKRKYGLSAVRPLADNTMKRIICGVDKFTIKNGNPFIVPIGYGEREGQAPRANSIDEPVRTVVSKAKHCLIAPVLIQYHDSPEFRGQAATEPIMTVDGSNRYGLAEAHLTEYFGNAQDALSLSKPLHTVTAKDREALTLAHIAEFKGQDKGQSAYVPLRTVTSSAGEFAAVYVRAARYEEGADLGYWPEIRKLLNTYCGYSIEDNEIILLNISGNWVYMRDIGLRMLTPRELYNAMGFPPDYCIDFDVDGKPYSKSEKVARCGNAVCPVMSEALVRANFPERCSVTYYTMSALLASVGS